VARTSSELAEEAERAKGFSSLLTRASAQGEGTPDAKSWGTRYPLGVACVCVFQVFSLTFLQYHHFYEREFMLKNFVKLFPIQGLRSGDPTKPCTKRVEVNQLTNSAGWWSRVVV
jgi:hypothetical protein